MIAVDGGQRPDDDPVGDLAGELAKLEDVGRVVVNREDFGADWLDVIVDAQTIRPEILELIVDHGCAITVVSTNANPRYLTITEEPR